MGPSEFPSIFRTEQAASIRYAEPEAAQVCAQGASNEGGRRWSLGNSRVESRPGSSRRCSESTEGAQGSVRRRGRKEEKVTEGLSTREEEKRKKKSSRG